MKSFLADPEVSSQSEVVNQEWVSIWTSGADKSAISLLLETFSDSKYIFLALILQSNFKMLCFYIDSVLVFWCLWQRVTSVYLQHNSNSQWVFWSHIEVYFNLKHFYILKRNLAFSELWLTFWEGSLKVTCFQSLFIQNAHEDFLLDVTF